MQKFCPAGLWLYPMNCMVWVWTIGTWGYCIRWPLVSGLIL